MSPSHCIRGDPITFFYVTIALHSGGPNNIFNVTIQGDPITAVLNQISGGGDSQQPVYFCNNYQLWGGGGGKDGST